MIKTFEKIQNLKLKSKIFRNLNKYAYEHKKKNLKDEIITEFLQNKKKNLIFNSWRNIANSYKKTKLRLISDQHFSEESKKIRQDNDEEMVKLKMILESLEKDIQKEINERKSLAKLYDLSLKKGVEAFLRETNYIIDFDASRAQTPNERSFIDAENNYNLYVQNINDIKSKTK